MSLRARFRRLSEQARRRGYGVQAGCPACGDHPRQIVLVTSNRQPDGTIVPGPEMPKPCPACAHLPRKFIEIVKVIVDGSLDRATP